MNLPYLNIRNADPFEPVEYLCREFPELSHLVATTLLKIKLMRDLMALEDSSSAPRSPIIAENKDIMERKDHREVIDKLAKQVDTLYKAVKRANRFFWPSLLNPGSHLTARSPFFARGSIEEVQVVLQYSYDSWIETPGAIEVIKAKN